jgi:hypothetical protein
MATFLDVGLFSHFGVIFVVLIVFLILFGLLEYIKAFGSDKKGLHALLALMVALLFLVSKIASRMVSNMVPWFMVAIIFVFFTLILVRMFGPGEGDMKKLIADPNVYPWIIVFAVLILLISLGNAFGQGLLEKGEGTVSVATNSTINRGYTGLEPAAPGTTSVATPSFTTNLLNTLRHPKVLGMIFVLLIGAFCLLFLTKSYTKLS